MRTPEDLAQALRSAADLAEEPVDLLSGVAVRRRRRTRQRFQVALAAAGVVAVVTGGTLAVRGGGGEQVAGPRLVEPSATTASAGAGQKAEPAKSVWPQAVALLPKAAADGFKYRPITALSPTEILVAAESSFEKAGRLEAYDTSAGSYRTLTKMIPHPRGYFEQSAEVGEDYIVWYGETPNNTDEWADFWVTPRQGGAALKVGEVTGALARVDQIGVSKDHVVWSVKGGGVYQMPISGGAPEKIAGTDGLWLAGWPWVSDVPGREPEGVDRDKNQSILMNLVTGKRLTLPKPDGVTGLRCSTEWCVGISGENLIGMRVDGTDARTFAGDRFLISIYGGHFVSTGNGLYDLVSGKTALIVSQDETGGGGGGSGGMGTSSSPTLVFYWNEMPIVAREKCRTATDGDLPPGETPSPGAKVCEVTTVQPGKFYEILNLTAIR